MSKKPKKPTLNLPEIPPTEMWEYPYEVDAILLYIRGQLESGQKLEGHYTLQQDFEKLSDLGYPEERIQRLKAEFSKPAGERRIDIEEYLSPEFADWIDAVRDLLNREFAKEGVPKETRDKLIEEGTIRKTLRSIPLDNIEKVRRSMQARARNFFSAARRIGAAEVTPPPPRAREVAPAPPPPPQKIELSTIDIFNILGPSGTVKDLKKRCNAEIKYASEPLLACSMYAQLILHFTNKYLQTADPKERASIETFLAGEPGLVDKLEDMWTMYIPDGKIPAKIIETVLAATRDILQEQYGRIAYDPGQLTPVQIAKSREIAEVERIKRARIRKKKEKKTPEYPIEIEIPTKDNIRAEIEENIKKAR